MMESLISQAPPLLKTWKYLCPQDEVMIFTRKIKDI